MFRKFAFTFMVALMLSTVVVGPVFAAAPEKVTVCHKPGTPDEATLQVVARTEAIHLNHGDYSGPCHAPQSFGCDALNALVPDQQSSSISYTYIVSNLEFYPGEMIHVDVTATIHDVVNNGNYLFVMITDSAFGILAIDYDEVLPGQEISASADYTVVAGDDADGVGIDLIATEGYTLDAVHFSCTPVQ